MDCATDVRFFAAFRLHSGCIPGEPLAVIAILPSPWLMVHPGHPFAGFPTGGMARLVEPALDSTRAPTEGFYSVVLRARTIGLATARALVHCRVVTFGAGAASLAGIFATIELGAATHLRVIGAGESARAINATRDI
jgi:hypothetical protein